WLLSWGETRIASGLASIIQASVPIFNAVLAFAFFRDQRVAGVQLAGITVGFVGVALLVGAQPQGKILGAFAVVGMAACYGLGGLLTRRLLLGVPPVALAYGALFLNESIGVAAAGGLVLILAGVALGTRGRPTLRRSRTAVPRLAGAPSEPS